MTREKGSNQFTFWDNRQAFLLHIQEIEQKLYHQYNCESVCKELRTKHAVLQLRQRVHDFPTNQVRELFLPAVGMLISDFAMHDVLHDFQKK